MKERKIVYPGGIPISREMPLAPLISYINNQLSERRSKLREELLGGRMTQDPMEELNAKHRENQKEEIRSHIEQEKTYNRQLLAEAIVNEFLNRLDDEETMEQVAEFVATVKRKVYYKS